jgi:HEAT repeat protein
MKKIRFSLFLAFPMWLGLSFESYLAADLQCDPSRLIKIIDKLDRQNIDDIYYLKQCSNIAADTDLDLLINKLVNKLQDKNSSAVVAAADVLYNLGSKAKDSGEALANVLTDSNQTTQAKVAAADAIYEIQPNNPIISSVLIDVSVKDKSPSVRTAAISALGTNSNEEKEIIEFLINTADGNDVIRVRSAAVYALIDIADLHDPEFVRPIVQSKLLKIINVHGQEDSLVSASVHALDRIDANDEIVVATLLKLLSNKNDEVRLRVAEALADISRNLFGEANNLKDIDKVLSKIEKIDSGLKVLSDSDDPDVKKSLSIVNERLISLREKRQILYLAIIKQWLIGNRAVWIIHPLFWAVLILLYPRFRHIQAFFFWDKRIRSILGCWYVGPLITAVPFLRRRLFFPFKDSLLADAKLEFFEPQSYFLHSKVLLKGGKAVQSLADVLPAIKGQVILEGESGLGKTMLLRHLVDQTKSITVFLPAHKCENGVIEAIQAKLHGQAQDADFLRHLIYSGALDICIDGLNEVRAEVRANITAFVESYFKGNIVMTTQPLLWEPPATAKTYVLQPLQRNQIEQFLLVSQGYGSDTQAPEGKEAVKKYTQKCAAFLEQVLDDNQSPEELAVAQRILSNPMDLSVVGQLIINDLVPDLLQLQQQQYTLMAQEYEQSWNQKFPLQQFSEFVYQRRLNDSYGMTGEEFYQALSIMEQEQHRMVLSRQWKDASGEPKKEWSFRHDKIMEFFLVQSFLGPHPEAQEKRHQHLGDPRFRGIYLLLARLLPQEAALALREELIHYAADTKDHTVSDNYVQILRSRLTPP